MYIVVNYGTYPASRKELCVFTVKSLLPTNPSFFFPSYDELG
jgi:hypothetical protein